MYLVLLVSPDDNKRLLTVETLSTIYMYNENNESTEYYVIISINLYMQRIDYTYITENQTMHCLFTRKSIISRKYQNIIEGNHDNLYMYVYYSQN